MLITFFNRFLSQTFELVKNLIISLGEEHANTPNCSLKKKTKRLITWRFVRY